MEPGAKNADAQAGFAMNQFSFTFGDACTLAAMIIGIASSHVRLENRLTKIETRAEERKESNDKKEQEQRDWRRHVDEKLTQFNERLITLTAKLQSQEERLIRIDTRIFDIEHSRS